MPYALLALGSDADYRRHYIERYCRRPLATFDGYLVTFTQDMFYHAFFKSSHKDAMKDVFDNARAERIDWIKDALEDPQADLRVGFDNKRKKPLPRSRVAIVVENYVVIIRITDLVQKRAMFVTAFLANEVGLALILTSRKWGKKKPSV